MVLEETRSFFEACKTVDAEGWRDICDQNAKKFNDTIKKNKSSKALYQFVWVIIPLAAGLLDIVKKRS